MNEYVSVSLSRKDLLRYAKRSVHFCGVDLSRVSTVFLAQILQLQLNRVVNVHSLLDEVKRLEQNSTVRFTRKAEVFKHYPLKGLYKKHFYDASFLVMNLRSHFGIDFGGNKLFNQMFNEALATGDIDQFINQLSHNGTIGAYEKRASQGKVTGEWIVFQRSNEKNYYLTVAAHNEGDENIFKRVETCYDMDFSFLRSKT